MSDWENPVTDYWLKYYLDKESGVCTLCGNHGIISTEGIKDPRGMSVGRSNYCICPNGQSLRENSVPPELKNKLQMAIDAIKMVLEDYNWLRDYPDNTAVYNSLLGVLRELEK